MFMPECYFKKKIKNTHQNMTEIKLKKIINKHNLYFI